MKRHSLKLIYVLVAFVIIFRTGVSYGASVDELQGQIQDRNIQIKQLEEEIDQYKKEIEETDKQANTLQNTIKTLDVNNKKLSTDIKVTENKIYTTNLSIEDINNEITLAENKIEEHLAAVANTLREINIADDTSLVETLLAYDNMSMFWDEIETLERFQNGVRDAVSKLQVLKSTLQEKRFEEEKNKGQLTNLKGKLSDQKYLIVQNINQKEDVLQETKNKESEYKKILEEKERLKQIFEREMAELESELRIAIDPNSYPKGGAVFGWPFDPTRINPLKNITQLFGGTEFAKQNPHVYGRPFHNGTDFGMPTGTDILSAYKGIVVESGNTDAYPGCYSYGKWVLVKHPNGLSTLYAHLSLVKVSNGQEVAEGQLLGYSGNTGYTTGPHLHFTVYASQGVQVVRFGNVKTVTNCGQARIPVAPYEAYLDPLQYLPQS